MVVRPMTDREQRSFVEGMLVGLFLFGAGSFVIMGWLGSEALLAMIATSLVLLVAALAYVFV